MKIAAIGDLHCRIDTGGQIRELLEAATREADVLVLTGDLTDTGLPAEMESLLKEMKSFSLPVVAVLGNHDHESGQAEMLAQMVKSEGVKLLEGNVFEIDSVGFVGTKGFCGGFDELLIQPFGENALKTFIRTSIDEAITLENQVAKLDCQSKVAVLHYAPIKKTLEGEAPELFPFLGSSRLANALDRRGVDVIFHGHAHHGSPQGKTPGNTPVFNVCRFVLERHTDKPYCMYEL